MSQQKSKVKRQTYKSLEHLASVIVHAHLEHEPRRNEKCRSRYCYLLENKKTSCKGHTGTYENGEGGKIERHCTKGSRGSAGCISSGARCRTCRTAVSTTRRSCSSRCTWNRSRCSYEEFKEDQISIYTKNNVLYILPGSLTSNAPDWAKTCSELLVLTKFTTYPEKKWWCFY